MTRRVPPGKMVKDIHNPFPYDEIQLLFPGQTAIHTNGAGKHYKPQL
jgi:hypothetical protein